MPPSSDQDTKAISVIASLAQKQTQKSSSSGVTGPTKKEKKNGAAKDAIIPAVAKSNLMMPDSTKPIPAADRSDVPSPETKPVAVDRKGPPGITSPVFGALSANALAASAAQNTTEWARNVPAFSGSPGNLISLSDSPPTQPSSYDERSTRGWISSDGRTFNGHLPSASPPSHRRRPLSFQMDGRQGFEDYAQHRTPSSYRRSSMYSHQSARYGPHPPLPHHPQAHFYGAPELQIGLPSQSSGSKPGSQGYYCGFDTLTVWEGVAQQPETVVISGYEGGLNICRVSKGGMDPIMTLDGLRGGVFSAKILPWTGTSGNQYGSPLIAIVLHGPVLPSRENTGDTHPETPRPSSEAQPVSRSESVRGSPGGLPASPSEHAPNSITHYQTTVEVYSLVTKKIVTTLLSVPKMLLQTSINSLHFVPPAPMGALTISADAGNVVITSSTTGEVWVYRQDACMSEISVDFRCIGKFWTMVQRSLAKDTPNEVVESDAYVEGRSIHQSKTPLISLKGRWLAYCPSSSTSQIPLGAIVPNLTSTMRVPGLNSYTPPPLPLVTLAVQVPRGDEFWKRVSRQVSQRTLDVVGTLGSRATDAWNSYWKAPSATPPYASPTVWATGGGRAPQEATQHFPPTHGEGLRYVPSNTDPGLITIVDLEKLAVPRGSPSAGSHVLGTFKSDVGCSFISFAPSGLALFMASSKGDVYVVWDLMRIQHTKSSALQIQNQASSQMQHVRQLAIFDRLTIARIVDVAWSLPQGERLAIVTGGNTVHFHDMPASSFLWPPSRRRIKISSSAIPPSADDAEPHTMVGSIATSAVSAARNLGSMAFDMTRPRAFSNSTRPGFAATFTATANQGGKVVATGISKSLSAATGAILNLRQAGENKIHYDQNLNGFSMDCIKWFGNKDSLFTLVDGIVRLYSVRSVRSRRKRDTQRISVRHRKLDLKLPLIPDYQIAPAAIRAMDGEDDMNLSETDAEDAQWNPGRRSTVKVDRMSGTESSIPQAEIESNAPYQPFHTDRRVGLHIYALEIPQAASPSISVLLAPITPNSISNSAPMLTADEPWAFGLPIDTVKLRIGPSDVDSDSFYSLEDHRALPTSAMERVTTRIPDADEDVEQIVITTRRRKPSPRDVSASAEVEEGFFEDDCEVLDFASQRV